ncbi:hypothetical protein V3C99_007441 [Haemonchus contortus]
MLILALVFANIVHSLAYGLMLISHLWKVLVTREPCDVLVSALYCYIMRFITSTSYTAHTTVLLGLLLERVIATTLAATYEKRTAVIGYILLLVSLVSAILLSIAKQYRYCISESSYYCSSLTTENYSNVLVVQIFLFLMLVIAVIVFGLLIFLNRKIRGRISHHVSKKYQATENLRALRVLFPLLILHFIGYPLYFVASIVLMWMKEKLGEMMFRILLSALYFPSHYCLLSTLVLWYIIRKHKKQRQNEPFCSASQGNRREDDVYFQNYRSMWH